MFKKWMNTHPTWDSTLEMETKIQRWLVFEPRLKKKLKRELVQLLLQRVRDDPLRPVPRLEVQERELRQVMSGLVVPAEVFLRA
jgi:hypothetical protein